ncbi:MULTISPECIES: pyridoxal phosphate-dependent aminotransferase [Rubrivivax]|uniref:alanine transaminase n=1 Tax=Rubrivivax benzoatilyticus TaxID=316997 RepID=A0ABX0HXC8_9BURK|nr:MULTISPECIES: pyridoxal phosphate-dependent aminotransferase [Rubrivivax]MCD0417869.1 pyridoxal phosphate-dependent aminotransferase [Rubrivivax sp. JA1024]EGJ12547.1 aminotransferase AlaT [Rubrivivax benzoatilyticus JA2 = ATCC BAA-35]MCC9598028.1 pyridoxal phosphate-dependent aminotransferase [Rubrivivax sp. JA1055]MCC9645715.1 pyridoxal phosphate-dependent aminotransferase [Rubrivivax sp. JA1029]NHK98986.1 pyridoxal phosphate-dependent aminotransferase [Rubrivivax benzoatilyticus]
MKPIAKSSKLANVGYDIRGPVLDKARQMEEEGQRIIKLNIGNVAAFGLMPPDEIVQDMIHNLPSQVAAGYTDSKGLFAPRKAVVHYTQEKRIAGVTVDDVYLGNGASELIAMSMNALLDAGDEVLIPAPDYPLHTAVVSLSGGTPVHYRCDEGSGWLPDLDDIRAKVSPNTKAIVVINPNNPTGALYPVDLLKDIVEIARRHQLIVFADEIYDKTLYDGAEHTSIASLADDVLFVTFNGLSKNYRSCGYRSGWMVVSGEKRYARDYIEGLNMLASMRLCANTPGQMAIQTALGGYQSIKDLVAPGGRLLKQRDLAWEMMNAIPGVSVVKPKAALYMFPRLDPKVYPIADDQQFAYELLEQERVLIVQGTGFNWPEPDHFRLVFLPNLDDLTEAIGRIERFLAGYRKRHSL